MPLLVTTEHKHTTREAWLAHAADEMRPLFADNGMTIPETIRYSISFPSTGRKGKRIGECWDASASADNYHTIIIRADLGDPIQVLDVLAHELVHACLPLSVKHGKEFRKAATGIGLTGKMTATVAGEALREFLDYISDEIGPLPHGRLDLGIRASDAPKKQKSRMFKAMCPACEYTIRVSRQWANIGMPSCPTDGSTFVCDLPETDEESEREG